jgi:hypothetical protein
MPNKSGSINVDYLSLRSGEEPDPDKWTEGGTVEVWFYEGSLYIKLYDKDGSSNTFDIAPELMNALICKSIREDEEEENYQDCQGPL